MLRKEILGTKVRTESGLSKPLTLVKPNNDDDYKNSNFLDTDILLAKDIKLFVKGGENTSVNGHIESSSFNGNNGTTTFMYVSSSANKQGSYIEIAQHYLTNPPDDNIHPVFLVKLTDLGVLIYPKTIPYWEEIKGEENITGSSCNDITDSFLKNICIKTDFVEYVGFRFNSIGAYVIHSKDNLDEDAYITGSYKKRFIPFIKCINLYEYELRHVGGIYNDLNNIGYYKSDGTITSVDDLKTELGVSSSTSIIPYIMRSEDSNINSANPGGTLNVLFAAYVTNKGNSGSFTVGAYCSASDSYTPSGYSIHKSDPGYNDTFIFPMFNLNTTNSRFSTESINYTLRNITGIKSDNDAVGYYCSDGTVTTLDDLRTAIGSDVDISNVPKLTLSQEGKSSTTDLAYSGITLNQYLTSSTNPGQCKGLIAGGALLLIRSYTDASGNVDFSNPDVKISAYTSDGSIRAYNKDGNGVLASIGGQDVVFNAGTLTVNTPLFYGTDGINCCLLTTDAMHIGNANSSYVTALVNDKLKFTPLIKNASTGIFIKGVDNNMSFTSAVGIFIDCAEGYGSSGGIFIKNKNNNDLVTAFGGTKTIGTDIAAQSSITDLQSQIDALTARVAALEAKL